MVVKNRVKQGSPLVRRYKQLVDGQKGINARQTARTQAVLENLNANLKKLRTSSETFSQIDMQELRKKVDSKTLAKFRFETARKIRHQLARVFPKAKFSLISQAFGKSGERLGLVMVKPEMFAYANQVRKYLNTLGFEVLLVKNTTFDKRTLQLVYGKEFGAYPEFPIQAANLISGPSKLMVFKQKPVSELLHSTPFIKYLERHDPKAHAELIVKLKKETPPAVFDKLMKGAWQEPQPGTIRKEVFYPKLSELGVKNMTGLAQLLDPYGYFRQRIKQGAKTVPDVAYYQLTSIHCPSTVKELFNDVDALLTKNELNRLKKA